MKLQKHFTVTEYGEPLKGIIFMFGGWRFRRVWYLPGIRVLTKLGYQTVLFIPDNRMISAKTPLTELRIAADDTQAVLERYIIPSRKIDYIAMGVSFGTMFAAHAAGRNDEIKKVVLTTPFGNFEEHIERWQQNKVFNRVLVGQSLDVPEMAELLNSIIQVDDLSLIDDKQLYFYYADNDEVVHTEVTEAMIKRLTDSGLNPVVVKLKGGHYSAVFRAYIDLMRSRAFLGPLDDTPVDGVDDLDDLDPEATD